MTIYTRPYNYVGTGDDGPYNSSEWRQVWFGLFGNIATATNNDADAGVILGFENELRVQATSPASANVEVLSGAANIQGMWLYSDATVTVNVPANATGNTRLDIIYAEYDAATNNVGSIDIATGTTSLPTLTQNATGVYQIPLAYLAVPDSFATISDADIFDYRIFANVPRRVKSLVQNLSGVNLNGGDVVVYDTGNNQAVTTSTTPLTRAAGVIEGYIPNNGYGYIVTHGVTPVYVKSGFSRGALLSVCDTARQADDLVGLTSFAIALKGAAAGERPVCYVNVPTTEDIQTTHGDLLVRNDSNEIVRLPAPTTDGFPLTADSTDPTGWQPGNMSPLGLNRYGVMLRKSSNQSISDGVATDVTWNSEDWDDNAFHSGSSANVTIPSGASGTYDLDFMLYLTQTGGSYATLTLQVKVNGSTVQTYAGQVTTQTSHWGYSIPLELVATDVVKLTVTMVGVGSSARTVIGGSDDSYMALHYRGA